MLMTDMTEDQRAAVTALWQSWLPEGAELLELVDVLWSGWECDHNAALIREADGTVRIKILAGVSHPGDKGPVAMLEERVAAYERVAAETRRFLEIAQAQMPEEPTHG